MYTITHTHVYKWHEKYTYIDTYAFSFLLRHVYVYTKNTHTSTHKHTSCSSSSCKLFDACFKAFLAAVIPLFSECAYIQSRTDTHVYRWHEKYTHTLTNTRLLQTKNNTSCNSSSCKLFDACFKAFLAAVMPLFSECASKFISITVNSAHSSGLRPQPCAVCFAPSVIWVHVCMYIRSMYVTSAHSSGFRPQPCAVCLAPSVICIHVY
jgi:hypothetical protein